MSADRTAAAGAPRARRLGPRSLRWRLQVWLTLLLTAILGAMIATGYELARANRLRQIDADLEAHVTPLTASVREVYRDGPPPDGRRGGPPFEGPGPPDGRGRRRGGGPPSSSRPMLPPDRQMSSFQVPSDTAALFGAETGYYFVIWYRDGSVIASSDNAPADVPPPDRADRDTLPHLRSRDAARELVHCTGIGECALAGRSIAGDLAGLHALGLRLVLSGALVLALSLGGVWWITTTALRPVSDISAAAVRISAGHLSDRVRVADPDTELGRLASVLNETFARLEAAFARQTRFTSDAAHELRTPLAVLITEAQTALSRERTAAEYRETIGECLDAAQQMRRMTETLLALARLDDDAASTMREAVDLAACAGAAADRLRAHAAARQVTIDADLAPAVALSRRDRLDVVISNVLANAIAYNRPGGAIRVSTRRQDADAVVEIADTGIGIAAADLPHIFERFYRADKSRSRADGHAGLGLAISKAIMDAEGGAITVTSVEGQGSTFTLRVPGAHGEVK